MFLTIISGQATTLLFFYFVNKIIGENEENYVKEELNISNNKEFSSKHRVLFPNGRIEELTGYQIINYLINLLKLNLSFVSDEGYKVRLNESFEEIKKEF